METALKLRFARGQGGARGTAPPRNQQSKLQVQVPVANLSSVKRATYKKSRAKESFKRSPCAVACVLDLVGDKWTLLVVRDLLWLDKHQYNEFLQTGENIPTNILADRLKRLEGAGIVTKEAYQQNPVRYTYRLTSKGTALQPILKEIVVWGLRHLPYACMRDDVLRRLRSEGAAKTAQKL
jgi:DNA-binding HxlR family transcriptional regulator